MCYFISVLHYIMYKILFLFALDICFSGRDQSESWISLGKNEAVAFSSVSESKVNIIDQVKKFMVIEAWYKSWKQHVLDQTICLSQLSITSSIGSGKSSKIKLSTKCKISFKFDRGSYCSRVEIYRGWLYRKKLQVLFIDFVMQNPLFVHESMGSKAPTFHSNKFNFCLFLCEY